MLPPLIFDLFLVNFLTESSTSFLNVPTVWCEFILEGGNCLFEFVASSINGFSYLINKRVFIIMDNLL